MTQPTHRHPVVRRMYEHLSLWRAVAIILVVTIVIVLSGAVLERLIEPETFPTPVDLGRGLATGGRHFFRGHHFLGRTRRLTHPGESAASATKRPGSATGRRISTMMSPWRVATLGDVSPRR